MAKNMKLPLKHSFVVCVVAIVLPFVTHNANNVIQTLEVVVNVAKNVKLPLKYSFVVCVVAIVLPFVTHKAFRNLKCGYCKTFRHT